MSTENFKKIKEWGLFIYVCLIFAYFFLNILCHNSMTKGAVSSWVFIGPMLILPYVGFFISMHLISGKELVDESDKTEICERFTGLKASVVAFVTWLIVLVLLEQTNLEENNIIPVLCGCIVFLGIFGLLKRIDKRSL